MFFLCQFYEGYGQTECTAGCSMTLAGDWTAGNILCTHWWRCYCSNRSQLTTRFMLSGHVGPPLPCNSIKLVDVAEMNYLAVNGEGEVKTN